eukprot:763266-Hanusia_phi.AAC.6
MIAYREAPGGPAPLTVRRSEFSGVHCQGRAGPTPTQVKLEGLARRNSWTRRGTSRGWPREIRG